MKKGWFTIPGVQDGARTLEEQLQGLAPMLAECNGKTVLDLGCAEGLIAEACLRAGASRVYGLDNNPALLKVAHSLALDPHRVRFVEQNIDAGPDDDDRACAQSDIVLMLAVIHKLREPADKLRMWSELCGDLLVMRLPVGSSGEFGSKHFPGERCDSRAVLTERGFTLERTEPGPRGELVHYWRRRP